MRAMRGGFWAPIDPGSASASATEGLCDLEHETKVPKTSVSLPCKVEKLTGRTAASIK